jgi:TolB-like protein
MGCYSSIQTLSRATICIFLFFIILSTAAVAQQNSISKKKLNIAVLDFDARSGITAGEAATLSDMLNSELVKSGEFIVVDRNRIKAILSEQGFQQSEACSQVECIVEAGKILKVEKMFVGVVGKVGKLFNIGLQVVDVATAQIDKNISRQHAGDIEDLVTDIIPDMANQLVQELTGKTMARSGSSSTWYYYVGGAVLVGGGAAYFLLKPSDSTPAAAKDLPALPALP